MRKKKKKKHFEGMFPLATCPWVTRAHPAQGGGGRTLLSISFMPRRWAKRNT